MKFIRLFLRYSILLLCPVAPVASQDLIFSNDTAILMSCELTPPKIDSHWIHNTTDHDIMLWWRRTEEQIPDESFYLMIFNGTQYPPFTIQGVQRVYAHDSTNIIFEFWHTNILPGDSAILRIKIYDVSDSINTTHYQTVIQHCPLETSTNEPFINQQLTIFPNPMEHEATVILPSFQKPSLLVLYSMTGTIVRQLPVTNSEMHISRDGLPNGIYFLAEIRDGHVIQMAKLAVAD
jgi:hypothetical protein